MPLRPYDTIVASSSSLVRESLAALLRARCGSRAYTSHTAEQGLAASPSARVLVCDASDLEVAAFAALLEHARSVRPELKVIRIDRWSDGAALESTVAMVRSATALGSLPHESLTPLESKVILAVAAGLRNSDIARRMRRSSKTIEKHRANALRKLRIKNVAQLTAYALKHKLIDGDSILGPLED